MKKILFAVACAALLSLTGCVSWGSLPATSGSFAVAATNENHANIKSFAYVESDWMGCNVVQFISDYTNGEYDNIIDISMAVREKNFFAFKLSKRCKFSGVAVKYALDDRKDGDMKSAGKSKKSRKKKAVEEDVDSEEE